MKQAEVCSLCELHNRTREIELPVAKEAKVEPIVAAGSQRCVECGEETYKSRVLCSRCLFERRRQKTYKARPSKPAATADEQRTCRFCGQQNVHIRQWRKQQRMCSKSACWRQFLDELKPQPLAV